MAAGELRILTVSGSFVLQAIGRIVAIGLGTTFAVVQVGPEAQNLAFPVL